MTLTNPLCEIAIVNYKSKTDAHVATCELKCTFS